MTRPRRSPAEWIRPAGTESPDARPMVVGTAMERTRLPRLAWTQDPHVGRRRAVEPPRRRAGHVVNAHTAATPRSWTRINLQCIAELVDRHLLRCGGRVQGAAVIRRDGGVEDDQADLRMCRQVARVPGV